MNTTASFFSLVVMVFVTAPLFACGTQRSEVPQTLFGTWINSHEEDTKEFRVYRREDYELPRSRGREGFTIESDGRFEMRRIARGDGIAPVAGRWEIVTDGDGLIIRVALEDHNREPLHLRIASVTIDKLVLHR